MAHSRAFIDRTGDRYGRLVVIRRVENNKWRHTMWLCQCDCGNTATVASSSLGSKQSPTRSCGCLQREMVTVLGRRNRLPEGVAAFNGVLYDYKRSAYLRGLAWGLTDDEFGALTLQPCHYCGSPPAITGRASTVATGHYVHNGVDRKNNDRGYLPDNCVPCCKVCNRAKLDMPYGDYLEWIGRISGWEDSRIAELKIVETNNTNEGEQRNE